MNMCCVIVFGGEMGGCGYGYGRVWVRSTLKYGMMVFGKGLCVIASRIERIWRCLGCGYRG